eukprot:COSAG01_NODE_3011_length_6725_cov_71.575158_8_plen_78_part_00
MLSQCSTRLRVMCRTQDLFSESAEDTIYSPRAQPRPAAPVVPATGGRRTPSKLESQKSFQVKVDESLSREAQQVRDA